MTRLWLLQHASGGHELRLEHFSLFHLSVVMSVFLCVIPACQTTDCQCKRKCKTFWTFPKDIFRYFTCILTGGTWVKLYFLYHSSCSLKGPNLSLLQNYTSKADTSHFNHLTSFIWLIITVVEMQWKCRTDVWGRWQLYSSCNELSYSGTRIGWS